MGPPKDPMGRAGCPPSILLCWGKGHGLGKPVCPPTSPLPVPYILERHHHPPTLLVPLSPKGDHGLHFYLIPQVGRSQGGASHLGPQKE